MEEKRNRVEAMRKVNRSKVYDLDDQLARDLKNKIENNNTIEMQIVYINIDKMRRESCHQNQGSKAYFT